MKFTWILSVVLASSALSVHADNVLVVHGLSTTSEVLTTQENVDNWPTVCNANNQHTVTFADTPPSSVLAYDQIWDIRFSNSSPLSSADQTSYAAAIAAGKSIFLMGENSSFATRNASVTSFVSLVGGGQLTMTGTGSNTQQVNAPLNVNGVSSITFNAGGFASATGLTGVFATEAGGTGTSFLWERGTLGGTQGKLAVVFDVNFMMTSNGPGGNNGAFFANLCENLSLPLPTVVANNDTVSSPVTAGQPTAVDVLSNDVPTGDTLNPASVTIVTTPTQGSIPSIDPATGQVTYLPNAQASGTDSFTYQVCLTNNPTTCATATVNLTVIAVAAPSVAANDDVVSGAVTAGQPATIDLLGNDVATGDTLNPASVSIVTPPTQGNISSIDPATGQVIYLPNAQASGAESFSYQVCLTNHPSTCATATVNLNVTPIASAQVQPVPFLGSWGLGLLSLSIALCVMCRSRLRGL